MGEDVVPEAVSGRGHIALYIGSLTMGGAERVMVNLAEALFSRGWRVTFVTTYIADEEYEVPHGSWRVLKKGEEAKNAEVTEALTLSEKKVRVALFSDGSDAKRTGVQGGIARVFSGVSAEEAAGRLGGFYKRSARLSEIWEDIKPDVILSFIGKNNLMALMTSGRGKIPVVVSVRATPEVEYPSFMMKLAANLLFPRAAAVAVQSEAAACWFLGRVRRRAVVLKNSVGNEFVKADLPKEREKAIVAVGRLDRNKNIGMLIRAFARLDDSEYRLCIYGDGEDRESLKAEAGASGAADRIQFMGRQQNIADKIRGAGIYCLTSDREGMPNTLIEAMCLGLPCVTTDCVYGGIGQFVRDGENALVIDKGDEEALVLALRRLIEDGQLAERLGKNARKIRESYAPERVADEWERVLVRAIGARA